MVKYFFRSTFLLFIQFANGFVSQERRDLDKCVLDIIQRSELRNITDITLVNAEASLVKLLHSSLLHPVRFVSRTFYWPNNTLLNQAYVINCMDYYQYISGMHLVKRDFFWNPKAKIIIIIKELNIDLQQVSIFLLYNNIFNVAVITYDAEDNVEVYTFGLQRDECDRPAVKTLKLFSYCSELYKTVPIYKAVGKTSLQGCQVKFITHNYKPFISFTGQPLIESYLLSLVQEFENITVELVDYGPIENFGQRLENYTYTGMLHEMELYNVEGAVGGYILNLNRMHSLDFTYPYMMRHYRIVIARARIVDKWVTVARQFGLVTICSMFMTFCVCCVVVIYMETFRRNVQDTSREVLIVWGYFLNNISYSKGTKSGLPHRLLLLNILFHVYIVSCAIQASLLSATTHPVRDPEPSTVEEVMSNYQFIVGPNLNALVKNNPLLNTTNSKQICKSTLDCVKEVMNSDQLYYTLLSDINHMTYIWNLDEFDDLRIKIISESVETVLHTMYISRGSPLAEPIDSLLARANNAGLIGRLLNLIQFEEQIKHHFHSDSFKKPQSLSGMVKAFMVLFTGSTISSIFFMFELWCRRYVSKVC